MYNLYKTQLFMYEAKWNENHCLLSCEKLHQFLPKIIFESIKFSFSLNLYKVVTLYRDFKSQVN